MIEYLKKLFLNFEFVLMIYVKIEAGDLRG